MDPGDHNLQILNGATQSWTSPRGSLARGLKKKTVSSAADHLILALINDNHLPPTSRSQFHAV